MRDIFHGSTKILMVLFLQPYSQTLEVLCEEYLKKNLDNPNVIFLSICDIKSDLHIGNIKIGPINWINRNAEFGRLIGDKSYRKKGIGKEVVHLTLNYLFSKLNMYKVYAGCLKINLPAIKSNKKCGMKVEAILKEKYYHNNKFHDSVVLSIKKSSWQKNKKIEVIHMCGIAGFFNGDHNKNNKITIRKMVKKFGDIAVQIVKDIFFNNYVSSRSFKIKNN